MICYSSFVWNSDKYAGSLVEGPVLLQPYILYGPVILVCGTMLSILTKFRSQYEPYFVCLLCSVFLSRKPIHYALISLRAFPVLSDAG